jgi:hypothetical protein
LIALPLKAKDELYAITNNDRNLDSSVMMSSVIPSLKYCCSGSLLRFSNASTAIDGLSGRGRPPEECSVAASGLPLLWMGGALCLVA